MLSLLKELSEAPGIAGREHAVIEIMKREFSALTSEVSVDPMGNVTALKRCGKSGAKKVMVSAHMDEVGSVVNHIDRNGFIRFSSYGRQTIRSLHSQRVKIFGRKTIVGTVEGYPLPFMSDEPRPQVSRLDQLYVDTGMSESEVREHISVGDMIVLDAAFVENGDAFIGKAFDDRIGCYILIEALKRLGASEVDVYFVATTQEEVGHRGAMRAAREINPDIGIALDVSLSFDVPGVEPQYQVSRLGEGVGIKISDATTIANHGIVQHLNALAREYRIPHQPEILPHGGVEARSIQMFGQGAVAALSIPTRYVHTPNEMVNKHDVEATIQLLVKFLESAHRCTLAFG